MLTLNTNMITVTDCTHALCLVTQKGALGKMKYLTKFK